MGLLRAAALKVAVEIKQYTQSQYTQSYAYEQESSDDETPAFAASFERFLSDSYSDL